MEDDPFDTGSELSSAEESFEERAPQSAHAPADPADKRGSDGPPSRDAKRPRLSKRDAGSGSEYEGSDAEEPERERAPRKPAPSAKPAHGKPQPAKPPAPVKSPAPAKSPAAPGAGAPGTSVPRPRTAPDESTEMLPARPARPAERQSKDPSFARNMSGWDQLFGGLNASPAPEPSRAKDVTPEQRAAMREEATAKAAAASREARKAAAEAQEQEKRNGAAMAPPHDSAPPRMPEPPAKPRSVTLEELDEKHARLRAEVADEHRLDLLAHARLMTSFEEDMREERRHLRASRFGAGIHYLGSA